LHIVKQRMRFTVILLIVFTLSFLFSCQKAETVEADIQGAWERVVFNHHGSEQWVFTPEFNIYVILTLPGINNQQGEEIMGDTVCTGSFTTKIVHFNHGTFLNKDIFRVPQITITGFTNFKYSGGNIDFTAYNTIWQVNKLTASEMIMTTDMYNNIHGGLEQREFYKQ